MKKFLSITVFISALLLISCQSKEEKAEKLIYEQLNNTLYDIDSYDPISTTVEKAYQTGYNDSVCFALALVTSYSLTQTQEYLEKAENAQRYMDIWGVPTYYSSTYSDNQYYRYQKESDENLQLAQASLMVTIHTGKELQDSIMKLDNSKEIGWQVTHNFRCKTQGGMSTIAHYRYIIDQDFHRILLIEDLDDEDYSRAREIIKMAIDKEFDEYNETDAYQ